MLCSIHVGELGWKRRPDLEAQDAKMGQVWQSPEKPDKPSRIVAFGPGNRPNVLHRTEPDLVVPNYSGWG